MLVQIGNGKISIFVIPVLWIHAPGFEVADRKTVAIGCDSRDPGTKLTQAFSDISNKLFFTTQIETCQSAR